MPPTATVRTSRTADTSGGLGTVPETEVCIENPVMRGAVIDYKATALALAAQVIHLNERHASRDLIEASHKRTLNKLHDTIGRLYAERENFQSAIEAAGSHWSAIFWPRRIWGKVNQAKLNPQ